MACRWRKMSVCIFLEHLTSSVDQLEGVNVMAMLLSNTLRVRAQLADTCMRTASKETLRPTRFEGLVTMCTTWYKVDCWPGVRLACGSFGHGPWVWSDHCQYCCTPVVPLLQACMMARRHLCAWQSTLMSVRYIFSLCMHMHSVSSATLLCTCQVPPQNLMPAKSGQGGEAGKTSPWPVLLAQVAS